MLSSSLTFLLLSLTSDLAGNILMLNENETRNVKWQPNRYLYISFTGVFMVIMLIAVQLWVQIVTFNIWFIWQLLSSLTLNLYMHVCVMCILCAFIYIYTLSDCLCVVFFFFFFCHLYEISFRIYSIGQEVSSNIHFDKYFDKDGKWVKKKKNLKKRLSYVDSRACIGFSV